MDNPAVFDFTDYRQFLKAYYQFQKQESPAFSYRYFALRAKINSSGFYKNVIDGKRSLGRSLILRFSEAMKLRKNETDYFENMVYFNEAKTVEEKRIFFERMLALRKVEAYLIQDSQFEFYSKWYYSAIRELIGLIHFKDDFTALGRLLVPPIRPVQAEKAIKVLEDLKFIAKDQKEIYRQVGVGMKILGREAQLSGIIIPCYLGITPSSLIFGPMISIKTDDWILSPHRPMIKGFG